MEFWYKFGNYTEHGNGIRFPRRKRAGRGHASSGSEVPTENMPNLLARFCAATDTHLHLRRLLFSGRPQWGAARWICIGCLQVMLGPLSLFLPAVRGEAQVDFRTASFTNSSLIRVKDEAPSTPYPSTLEVTEVEGAITNLTLTLFGLSHTWPNDIDILLVSPSGMAVVVFSDVGGGHGISNVTVKLDDAAQFFLPYSSTIPSGTYRPTDLEPSDIFAPPAPAGPYKTNFTALRGSAAAGTWKLFVADDGPADTGEIAGGWSLTITTVANSPVIKIASITPLANNHLLIIGKGEAGVVYSIQACADLVAWQKIGEARANANGVFEFEDAQAPRPPTRFYQVSSP